MDNIATAEERAELLIHQHIRGEYAENALQRIGTRMVETLQEHEIKNIVLMERTALLFRTAIRSLIRENGLDIRIFSIDPSSIPKQASYEYHEEDFMISEPGTKSHFPETDQCQQGEKLLKKLRTSTGNTLLLDEIWLTGRRMINCYHFLKSDLPSDIFVGALTTELVSFIPSKGIQPLIFHEDSFEFGFGGWTKITGEIFHDDTLQFKSPIQCLVYRKIALAFRDALLGKLPELS